MCSTCATLERWPAAWTGDPSGPPAWPSGPGAAAPRPPGCPRRPVRRSPGHRPATTAATDVRDVVRPRRHCWVSDGAAAGRRAAGLLVEWRQLGGAWQGRVAYVVDVDGEATLVEAWVPASQLERADG